MTQTFQDWVLDAEAERVRARGLPNTSNIGRHEYSEGMDPRFIGTCVKCGRIKEHAVHGTEELDNQPTDL